jgi:single-stranded DNA-binding protein
MYLNRITLIGFLGSDAERKATNSTNVTIFSLATKTSWKNDAGSLPKNATLTQHRRRESPRLGNRS